MGISGGGGGGGGATRGFDYTAGLQQAMQQIWAPQAQALQGMYSGVSNLMNQQAPWMQQIGQGYANAAMPGMQTAMAGLQGVVNGQGPLAQYAQPNNALAQEQLGQYSQQVGQEFARNIMPQIRSGAGVGGNMGGSREALARGVAAGDAARAISTGGTNLYAQQYGIGAQAAGQLQQNQVQAAGMLPQVSQGIYNLGMQPYQAAWAPYTAAASIFGGPQALSASQGINLGESWNQGTNKGTKPSWGFSLF